MSERVKKRKKVILQTANIANEKKNMKMIDTHKNVGNNPEKMLLRLNLVCMCAYGGFDEKQKYR